MAHLVADLHGYEEYPAMKQVFKDSLHAGYGKKLLAFYKQDPKSVPDKSIDLAKAFAKESHYTQELVSYGFDSMLFALGCSTSINKPLSQQEGNILDKLADQQAAYQKQYMDLLDRLLTKPDNMLRDAPGYYTTEALNQLYAVEAKICALQQQLNSADLGWCKQKREEKLVYYQKQKSNFVRKTVDDLKKKYLHVLSSSLVIPKKLFIKRSGYYTADTLNIWEKLLGIRKREAHEAISTAHKNMAAAIQYVAEKILLKLALHAKKVTGLDDLCLAGGCALNCSAMGKIRDGKSFRSVYVPFAPVTMAVP